MRVILGKWSIFVAWSIWVGAPLHFSSTFVVFSSTWGWFGKNDQILWHDQFELEHLCISPQLFLWPFSMCRFFSLSESCLSCGNSLRSKKSGILAPTPRSRKKKWAPQEFWRNYAPAYLSNAIWDEILVAVWNGSGTWYYNKATIPLYKSIQQITKRECFKCSLRWNSGCSLKWHDTEKNTKTDRIF